MFYGPGYGMPFHQQQMMMMHGMYNPMMQMPPAGANGEPAGDRRDQEAMMFQQQQFMRNAGNPMMMYNMYGMPYMMPPPGGEEGKDGEAPKDDTKPPVDGAVASAAESGAPVKTDAPAVGEKRDISTMSADQPGGAEESEKKKVPEV